MVTDWGLDFVWCGFLRASFPTRPPCALLRSTLTHLDQTMLGYGQTRQSLEAAGRSVALPFMQERFPDWFHIPNPREFCRVACADDCIAPNVWEVGLGIGAMERAWDFVAACETALRQKYG